MTSVSLLLRRSTAVLSSTSGIATDGAVGAARSDSSSWATRSAFRLASVASASLFFFPCTFLSLLPASIVSVGLHERHADAPKELFTVHLVKLAHDIFNCIIETGNDDMLDGVHAAVSCTNNFVEDHECRLK